MAKEVIIRMRDDIDGSFDEEGGNKVDVQTVKFSWGGKDLEVDLSASNRDEFAQAILPYVEVARNAPRKQRDPKPAKAIAPAPAKPGGGDTIREWARANGYVVAPMGKLPRDVVEAYDRQRFAG